jgi:hypothetical protein
LERLLILVSYRVAADALSFKSGACGDEITPKLFMVKISR